MIPKHVPLYFPLFHSKSINFNFCQLLSAAIKLVFTAHAQDDVFRTADWLSTKARGMNFDSCQKVRSLANHP